MTDVSPDVWPVEALLKAMKGFGNAGVIAEGRCVELFEQGGCKRGGER